jgi:hypothetical protein
MSTTTSEAIMAMTSIAKEVIGTHEVLVRIPSSGDVIDVYKWEPPTRAARIYFTAINGAYSRVALRAFLRGLTEQAGRQWWDLGESPT